MVLMGQSAGGGSVDSYAYAWVNDPIVHGLISESGIRVPLAGGPDPSNFTTLAGLVGCGGLGAQEELSCMQGIDAQLLEDTNSQTDGFSFTPKADGLTVFPNKTERIEQGLVAKIVSEKSKYHGGLVPCLLGLFADMLFVTANDRRAKQ